ncbi:MAG: hypothetical protein CO093_08090 [Alphaproteobacteria bacterium CG_4_9_14_3_um_filter_47_13]|nr:MAG: hypothetical protein CO093_08090 [Alphaproteobacteria bacterium CG_4_9_14_3_um_filter_47_13]
MTKDQFEDKNPPRHFSQPIKRKAEFIKPPNMLKAKVGSGGLSDEIIEKAQSLLQNNAIDFQPLADMYLGLMMEGINSANSEDHNHDGEVIIADMLYPAMQLKANGGMFNFPLVTSISDRLVQFLEVIEEADANAVEIVLAFHTTIRAVINGKITGNGGSHGTEILSALNKACVRYFEKHPENHNKTVQDYKTKF